MPISTPASKIPLLPGISKIFCPMTFDPKCQSAVTFDSVLDCVRLGMVKDVTNKNQRLSATKWGF